jgi:ankyrin repeat protein/Ca2+-binding EF-hand superfamily protein
LAAAAEKKAAADEKATETKTAKATVGGEIAADGDHEAKPKKKQKKKENVDKLAHAKQAGGEEAAAEKKVANEKAAAEKKTANEKAAIESKAANEKAAAERNAAEEKASTERKAAEVAKAAKAQAVIDEAEAEANAERIATEEKIAADAAAIVAAATANKAKIDKAKERARKKLEEVEKNRALAKADRDKDEAVERATFEATERKADVVTEAERMKFQTSLEKTKPKRTTSTSSATSGEEGGAEGGAAPVMARKGSLKRRESTKEKKVRRNSIKDANRKAGNAAVDAEVDSLKKMVGHNDGARKEKIQRGIEYDKTVLVSRAARAERLDKQEAEDLAIIDKAKAEAKKLRANDRAAVKKLRAAQVEAARLAAIKLEDDKKINETFAEFEAASTRLQKAIETISDTVRTSKGKSISKGEKLGASGDLGTCVDEIQKLKSAQEDLADQKSEQATLLTSAAGVDGKFSKKVEKHAKKVEKAMVVVDKALPSLLHVWEERKKLQDLLVGFNEATDGYRMQKADTDEKLSAALEVSESPLPVFEATTGKKTFWGAAKRTKGADEIAYQAMMKKTVAIANLETVESDLKEDLPKIAGQVEAMKTTSDVEGCTWSFKANIPNEHVVKMHKAFVAATQAKIKICYSKLADREKHVYSKLDKKLAKDVRSKHAASEKIEKKKEKPRKLGTKALLMLKTVAGACTNAQQQLLDRIRSLENAKLSGSETVLEMLAGYANESITQKAKTYSGKLDLNKLKAAVYKIQPKKEGGWFGKEFSHKVAKVMKEVETIFEKVEDAIDKVVFIDQVRRRIVDHEVQSNKMLAWFAKQKENIPKELPHSRSTNETNRSIDAMEYLIKEAQGRLAGKPGLFPRAAQQGDVIAKLFAKIDVDGGGDIDFEELSSVAMFAAMSKDALRTMFDTIDTDKGGSIDLEEFRAFCEGTGLFGDSSGYVSAGDDPILDLFKKLDLNLNGAITVEEIKIGDSFPDASEEQLVDMFAKIDINKNGSLDLDEFRMFFQGANASKTVVETVTEEETAAIEDLKAANNWKVSPEEIGKMKKQFKAAIDECKTIHATLDKSELSDAIQALYFSPADGGDEAGGELVETKSDFEAYLAEQEEEVYDFPLFFKMRRWKGFIDPDDDDYEEDESDGVDLEKAEEARLKAHEEKEKRKIKELEDMAAKGGGKDDDEDINYRAYSEPDLSKRYVTAAVSKVTHKPSKSNIEFYQPGQISLYDLVEVVRWTKATAAGPAGLKTRKTTYELGTIVGAAPNTFEHAKGSDVQAKISKEVFAVRFHESNELEEFVAGNRIRKLGVEAMALTMVGAKGLYGETIGPSAKGKITINNAVAKRQLTSGEGLVYQTNFGQQLCSPAVYIRRPKGNIDKKGQRTDEFPQFQDNGRLLSFRADTEYFVYGKKALRNLQREYAPTNIPLLPLGAYLAGVRWKTKYSEFQLENPAKVTNLNLLVDEEFANFESEISMTLAAYKTQLKRLEEEEAVFGKTVGDVWADVATATKAKLKFGAKGLPALPLVTVKVPINGAYNGPMPLQSVSHVNNMSVGPGMVLKQDDFKLQITDPKMKSKETPRDGAYKNPVTAAPSLQLWTVHRHTTQVIKIPCGQPAAKTKPNGLAGIQVIVEGGFVRVVGIIPAYPASKMNIGLYDIISSVGSSPSSLKTPPDLWWNGETSKAEALVKQFMSATGDIAITVHSNRFELLVSPLNTIVTVSTKEFARRNSISEVAKAGGESDESEDEAEDAVKETDEEPSKSKELKKNQVEIISLGFTVASTKQQCVRVAKVDIGGGACQAGLQIGDILTHIDGWPLRGSSDIEIAPLLKTEQPLMLSVSRPTAEHPATTVNSVRPLKAQREGSIRSLRLDIRRSIKVNTIVRRGDGVPKQFKGYTAAAVEGGKQYNDVFVISFAGNRITTPLIDALRVEDLLFPLTAKPAKKVRKDHALKAVLTIIADYAEAPGMLNESTNDGETALGLACELGLVEVVAALANLDALDLNSPDKTGEVPMIKAIKSDSVESVQILLEAGANPNVTSIKGGHALLLCFESKKPKMTIARLLLHSGLLNADRDRSADELGDTVHRVLKYHKKSPNNALACVELLIKYGANLNRMDGNKKSTLGRAIEFFGNSAPAVPARMILNDGPYAIPLDKSICEEVYNKGKKDASTPLIWMVGKKQTVAAGKLIAMGVSGQSERYNIPDQILSKKSEYHQPCTPFELSVFTGAGGCAEIFVSQDPAMYATYMQMPPGYIFGVGFDPKGWKLVKEEGDEPGASKYARNEELCISALLKANKKDALEWIELFRKHKLNFDVRRSYGINITNALVALGHADAALTILKDTEHKVELDVVDDRNRSLLFYAAYSRRNETTAVLEYLLEKGTDPRIADGDGVTPLLAAARNNDNNSVMRLRNINFSPVEPQRPLDPTSEPHPVGKAEVIGDAVDPTGIRVYKDASDTSQVVCDIKGIEPPPSPEKLKKKSYKTAAALVKKQLEGIDYEISGTVTIECNEAGGDGIDVTMKSAVDLAPQKENDATDPHYELFILSDEERKKVLVSEVQKDTTDPEWDTKHTFSPTRVDKKTIVQGSVKFDVSFDPDSGLSVQLKSVGTLAKNKVAPSMVVSLMRKNGDRTSHEFAEKQSKKGLTEIKYEGKALVFDIDKEGLSGVDLVFELKENDKNLLGICCIDTTAALAKGSGQDLPFKKELWQYQVLVVELWQGKRGAKDGKFLGQSRYNLAAAAAHEGAIEDVALLPINSSAVWGEDSRARVLKYNDLFITERKGDWFKLHHCEYDELTENQGAALFDPYIYGWVKLVGNDSKRTYLRYNDKAFTQPKSTHFGKDEKGKKREVFTPFPDYKKNSAYAGVSGDELNRKDNFGNTVLYYAVLHESVDLVRNLLEDPKVDVNAVCAEGMTPFMLSIIVKPRGNVPIFYTFVEKAGDRIDWEQVEDKGLKTDPKIDVDGKPNNLADYALMEEFCYAERPMLNLIQTHGCKPTGEIARLIEFEALIEQDRMQSYALKEVTETVTVVETPEKEADAAGDPDPIAKKVEQKVQKEVKGTITYSMEYLPNEYGGYGGLSVKIVKAEGLEVHEMNEKVKKSKSKAGKAVIDVETTRWVNPFVDIVLIHDDQDSRRDAVKRKTKTVKKVLGGKLASFVQTKTFELSRTACDKKCLALEVWHNAGLLKSDVFLGIFKVSVKEALASQGKLLTVKLEAVEVPAEVVRAEEFEPEGGAEDDEPQGDEAKDDEADPAADGKSKVKRKQSWIEKKKEWLKADNVVPAWTNTLHGDLALKQTLMLLSGPTVAGSNSTCV